MARQIEIEVSPAQLEEIKAKRKDALAKLGSPYTSWSDRAVYRRIAMYARILELAAKDKHRPTKQMADQVAHTYREKCSVNIVRSVLHRFNEIGLDVLKASHPGRKPDIQNSEDIKLELRVLHEEFPNAGPSRLVELLRKHYSRHLSLPRVSHYLQLAGIGFRRKNRSSPG